MPDENPSPDSSEKAEAPLLTGSAGDAADIPLLPFQVVGIGASAGGLEAYRELLQSLSPETGMAFVIVSHLSAEHKSQLVPILSRYTAMPVIEIADGIRCESNRVYVLPPNARVIIDRGCLKLEPRPARDRVPRPIDYFFRSLAADQRNHAVGVVLSGSDSDGALGLKAIKGEGGIAIVQSPSSARFPDMPLSGIGGDHVDLVLPPDRIGIELAHLAEQFARPELKPLEEGNIPQDDERQFARILAMLRSVSGIDFRNYKPTTLRRRLARRMLLKHFDSLPEYALYLQGRPGELRELQEDLLINVTHFFRDPDVFDALKAEIFPHLLEGRPSDQPIRIWSAGCSSGEEAYSLAMCLLESVAGLPVEPFIQIFGTDASEESIEKARAGVYPLSIASEVSPERLRRFFVKAGENGYQIAKRVRDLCVFARQNLCSDPPFSRMDLVSCRNVLIYLTPQIQNVIVSTFHYSLKQCGFLLLGSSESLRDHSELFTPVDRGNKFYTKTGTTTHIPLSMISSAHAAVQASDSTPMQSFGVSWTELELQRATDRVLLARHGPPGVVVNDKMEVLQVRGQVGPYLQIAPGMTRLQLLRMARDDLVPVLYDLLQRSIAEDVPGQVEGVRVRNEDQVDEISIEVLPIQSIPARPRCYLVLFLTSGASRSLTERLPPPETAASRTAGDRTPEVEQLRLDLTTSRQYLQSLIEERDIRNQELTSAYEEVQSANEELQSANEELETAKEELQSTNEELQTINEELRTRNVALVQATNDFTNLFNNVNIPLIMLGIDLTIRHFTPPTERLMRIRSTDIGRPIGEVRLNLKLEAVEPLLQEVLDTLATKEMEVEDREGRWHLLRIRPYRTGENKIEGLVLVLLDIDQFRRAEQALRDARDFAQTVLESVPAPLVILNEEYEFRRVNAAFRSLSGLDSSALEHHSFPELANLMWNLGGLAPKLDEMKRSGAKELDFEHWTGGADGKVFRFKVLPVQLEGRQLLLVMLDDVTSQKEAERVLEEERQRLAGEVAITAQALDRTQNQMRELAGSLLNSQENESRRLARDLHDDVGQKLAVLQIEIQRLLDKPPAEPQELKERMQSLVERTVNISTDVRTLSHQLHPAIIEDLGLAIALEELVKEFGRSEDMPATFSTSGVPPKISLEMATALYRIAQEALSNVAKHAGKTHVRVNLAGKQGGLLLRIRDLGHGFETSQERRAGLGLVSMEERARLVGGIFRVQSQVNGGTSVEVEVPLTAEPGVQAN